MTDEKLFFQSPKPVTRPHLSASAASSIGQVGPTTAPALLAEDDGVRIIQIEKTNEPLGATIRLETTIVFTSTLLNTLYNIIYIFYLEHYINYNL